MKFLTGSEREQRSLEEEVTLRPYLLIHCATNFLGCLPLTFIRTKVNPRHLTKYKIHTMNRCRRRMSKKPLIRADLIISLYMREEVELLPRPADEMIQMPEVLVLDQNNIPLVKSDLVEARPLLFGGKLKYVPLSFIYFSIPKKSRTIALATFALSVGYIDPTLPIAPHLRIPSELSPAQGTAVAIDNHHLLTVAHCLEFDTALRKWPTNNLKYKYSPLMTNII